MASNTMPSGSSPAPAAGRRVLVSLKVLPAETPGLKEQLTTALQAHLPLADLQWKSSSRGTTRVIDSLNLELRDYKDVLAGNASLASSTSSSGGSSTTALPPQLNAGNNLLERPYLHILYVGSDDNEVYRVTLRPQIREWIDSLQSLSSKKSSALEWLIVHVTAQKTGPAKFYQRKGSVYDKVRADFNTGKKDRCVQLPLPGSMPSDAEDSKNAWNDFLARIKRNIVDSFDINFSSYEEDVRKVDQQRQLPGWNFCTFFVLKEGLAHAFESMNLLEDSLVQYDELEASYMLSGKDQALPWFSRLGGNEAGDDALSILSAESKPFRALIAKNAISIFDFRIYLFSRQAALVCALGRVSELAGRAKPFIYSISRLLRAHGGALQKHFLEIWIYSATLELVAKCRALLRNKHSDLNPAAIPDLLPTLAELLELACRQVEKLGMSFGYLPRQHPFLMSADLTSGNAEEDGPSPQNDGDFPCSNDGLRSAMQNEHSFDTCYRGLVHQAIEAWTGSLRMRSANKLRGTIAALEQARKRSSQAESVYSSLSSSFSQTRWTSIEAQLLRQSATLQGELQRPRDRLLSTLALVRSGMEVGSMTWASSAISPQTAEREAKIARELMYQIKELSITLDKDFAAVNFPTFKVEVQNERGGFPEKEDGVTVDVVINNALPCAIDVDEVRIKLVSTSGEPLWLTADSNVLSPGSNFVRTESFTSVTGTYSLELSQIKTSRIVFQYSHYPKGANRSMGNPQAMRELLVRSGQPFVTFGHDPFGIDVSLQESRELHLDRHRQMTVCIHPGRGKIERVLLRLLPPNGRLRLYLDSAKLQASGAKTGSLICRDGGIEISGLESTEDISITLDYEVTTQEPTVSIGIALEYYTSSRGTVKRILRTSANLRLALPLAVNVQDFLRDTCILSRFTVSTDGLQPLRIQEAVLISSHEYTAQPALKNRRESVLVKREGPASFVFKIAKEETARNEEPSSMRLKLAYRTLEEESRLLLSQHVSTIFEERTQHLSRKLKHAIVSRVIASGQTIRPDSYRLQSPLKVGGPAETDQEQWKKRLRGYYDATPNSWEDLFGCIKAVCETPIDMTSAEDLPWRQLYIPFDPPTTAIYNQVSISFPEGAPAIESGPLRIGDLLSILLKIKTSFQWASDRDLAALRASSFDFGEGERRHRMLYEVITKNDDWIVAQGRKRGEFTIPLPTIEDSNEKTNEIEVELLIAPLRQGKLFLPSISVVPVSADYNEAVPVNSLPSCEVNNVSAGISFEVLEAMDCGVDEDGEQGLGRVSFWIDRGTGETGLVTA